MKWRIWEGNELSWIQVVTYLTQRISYRAFLVFGDFGIRRTFRQLRGHLSYHFTCDF
jgi:hypothetical protein